MSPLVHTALFETLKVQFPLNKSRLETLALAIVGVMNSRTMNPSHITSQFPREAKMSSHYRCLQQFFQYAHFDSDVVAWLVMKMLKPRFRIPLMWTLLYHRGNTTAPNA